MKNRVFCLAVLGFLIILMAGYVSAIECGPNPTDGCCVSVSTTFNPGTYNLPNGVDICASNIVLDCGGATLSGSGSGIENNGFSNVMIKNCIVKDYSVGIHVFGADGNAVENNNIENIGSYGLWFNSNSQHVAKNNIIDNIGAQAILLQESSGNNFSGNIVINSNIGIYIDNSFNSFIYNNFFNNTNNVAGGSPSGNVWNITKTPGTNIVGGPFIGGNFWHDYNGQDLNGDGLGDTLLPYDPGDFLPLVPILNDFPPVLDSIGNQEVSENNVLIIDVNATDPDNNPLIFGTNAYTVLPSPFSFNPITGLFEWEPTYDDAGEYFVTFNVTDGEFSDEETIMITVIDAPNNPPILNPLENQQVNENSILIIQLSASDPNNDDLTFGIIEDLPTEFSFDENTGLFTWNVPFVTGEQNYQITFNVTDGEFSDEETMTITIFDVLQDNPPVLEPIGNQIVNENETLFIQLVAIDPEIPDNSTLTYLSNAGDVLPSSFNLNRFTGLFQWTPTFDDAGNYSTTFFVTDGKLGDEETIIISVNNVNRAPEIEPLDNPTINENELLELQINAFDPDGDEIFYTTNANNVLPGQPIFNNETGEFSWTPGFFDFGIYEIVFNVSDGELTSTLEVTITVLNTQYPLLIDPIGDREIAEGETLTIDVNATDNYNPNSTINYFTNAQGILPSEFDFDMETGLFSWTPTYADSGQYDVTFFATNGVFWTDEEITITVFEGCIEDLDGTGIVEINDLLTLLANWDTSGLGDLDNDGIVGILDFLQLLSSWGPCPQGISGIGIDKIMNIEEVEIPSEVKEALENYEGKIPDEIEEVLRKSINKEISIG